MVDLFISTSLLIQKLIHVITLTFVSPSKNLFGSHTSNLYLLEQKAKSPIIYFVISFILKIRYVKPKTL